MRVTLKRHSTGNNCPERRDGHTAVKTGGRSRGCFAVKKFWIKGADSDDFPSSKTIAMAKKLRPKVNIDIVKIKRLKQVRKPEDANKCWKALLIKEDVTLLHKEKATSY